MIVDLDRFIASERETWRKLEEILDRNARDPWRQMSVAEVRELERLYQRTSADLAKFATFSAEPETRRYLEGLVARGYAEIHGAKAESRRLRPWRWFTVTWPQTFRRHLRPFALAAVLMMLGALFGGIALIFDPDSKPVLMPFEHLLGDPAERVAEEESGGPGAVGAHRAEFSGMLMTHNTRVSLLAMALGMTYGIGTIILLFYNGIGLGAVVVDYVAAGQTHFLLGWLLPHGVVELPAILVGGQAGLVLARALLGRADRRTMRRRLRAVVPDVVTLCFGAALMLVWAGLVEAFLSQHHEPAVPYAAKIAFGVAEAVLLVWFLRRSGRGKGASPDE